MANWMIPFVRRLVAVCKYRYFIGMIDQPCRQNALSICIGIRVFIEPEGDIDSKRQAELCGFVSGESDLVLILLNNLFGAGLPIRQDIRLDIQVDTCELFFLFRACLIECQPVDKRVEGLGIHRPIRGSIQSMHFDVSGGCLPDKVPVGFRGISLLICKKRIETCCCSKNDKISFGCSLIWEEYARATLLWRNPFMLGNDGIVM